MIYWDDINIRRYDEQIEEFKDGEQVNDMEVPRYVHNTYDMYLFYVVRTELMNLHELWRNMQPAQR